MYRSPWIQMAPALQPHTHLQEATKIAQPPQTRPRTLSYRSGAFVEKQVRNRRGVAGGEPLVVVQREPADMVMALDMDETAGCYRLAGPEVRGDGRGLVDEDWGS